MIMSLIVAASDNEVIGAAGGLPWHLPGDLRRFREMTTGHVVVMGRVTYESILARLGRPLPRRTSVVVSAAGPGAVRAAAAGAGRAAGAGAGRAAGVGQGAGRPRADVQEAGAQEAGGQVRWAGSLEAAIELAESIAASAGDEEYFIGGGVSVYSWALPVADRVYLTRVHQVCEGDRRMPAGWLNGFELVGREAATDPGAAVRYEWLDYRRAAR